MSRPWSSAGSDPRDPSAEVRCGRRSTNSKLSHSTVSCCTWYHTALHTRLLLVNVGGIYDVRYYQVVHKDLYFELQQPVTCTCRAATNAHMCHQPGCSKIDAARAPRAHSFLHICFRGSRALLRLCSKATNIQHVVADGPLRPCAFGKRQTRSSTNDEHPVDDDFACRGCHTSHDGLCPKVLTLIPLTYSTLLTNHLLLLLDTTGNLASSAMEGTQIQSLGPYKAADEVVSGARAIVDVQTRPRGSQHSTPNPGLFVTTQLADRSCGYGRAAEPKLLRDSVRLAATTVFDLAAPASAS